jgi:2-oxoglutarate ferredoxin oxidoreductase subunit beta
MLQSSQQHNNFDMSPETDIAWCPGCGNFPILAAVKKSLQQMNIAQQNVVFVSGIGQAAKLPQYVNAHYFNGLHGRALPVATGIKTANKELTVIVASGDGDVYGEGGNHFIHTIRRNPDITVLAHNNMIYGLTKGQASPTSEEGLVTPVQPRGVFVDPINPVALAISLDAPFVARANAGDPLHMQEMITAAIAHKGFSLVDIFQPCVVFNKVNTYQWFQDHTYHLDEEYDPTDRAAAFAQSIEQDKYALGVLYRNDHRAVFEEEIGIYDADRRPLYQRDRKTQIIQALVKERK